MKAQYIISALMVAGTCNISFAQHDTLQDYAIRAEVGRGFSSLVYSAGVYYLFDQTEFGASLVGARFIGMSEIGIDFDIGGTVPDLPHPREKIWVVGAVVGKTYSSRGFVFTAYTGLSLIGGVQRGVQLAPAGSLFQGDITTRDEYRPLDEIVLGIPVEFQLIIYPVDNVGIGASYLLHWNGRKSFNGAILGFGVSIP